jgi:hypothetical protein
MIYVLAIILSLIVCGQCFSLEIVAGNIGHVKNGRVPNAGAAPFPLIPILPLLAVGGSWLLQTFLPEFAVWILLGCFLCVTIAWAFSFAKLKTELKKAKVASSNRERDA